MKKQLRIVCMSLLSGVLLLQISKIRIMDGMQKTYIKESAETLSDNDDTPYYPNLIAPHREIKPLTEGEKICYLTFDDGPSENTEQILDILEENQIKASFFVVGESLTEERKETMQRIMDEGHAVGMHANVHDYEKLYKNLDSFLSDYNTLYETLKITYGIETALYRFPGGSACICLNGNGKQYVDEMKKRGFSCFDWNISGEDSVGTPTVSSIQRNVLSKGLKCRRAYVLLHDSNVANKTVEALPEIINEFREEGFVFESLENAESYVFPISR